jgi:F-box domain
MITKLPEHLLVEIFCLLSIRDVIRLQRASKYFYSLFKEFPMVLFNSLRGIYVSPFFPVGVKPTYQGVKRIFSKIHNSKVMMIEMLAYYTDGGYIKNDPYESMINIFSSNLFDSCYSAVKNSNVLIKALFCGGRFNYSVNRGSWEKKGINDLKNNQSTEIELEELKRKLETVLSNTCKDIIITGFCIEKPSLMNKSSFRTCMIFSSVYNADSSEIIEAFKSTSDYGTVIALSNSLNITHTTESTEEYSVVCFSLAKLPIRPLCWIQFHNRNIGTDILHIKLLQEYIGSYLYILFIDNFDKSSGMDIGTFITKGKILTLYE